ncbi:Glycoside hydrolase, catalytic domain-containing protein [Cynara cardunculus var. scolymus]|uniref:Glycoside hydrolase, catalytic domain-containing protein n=1 Tax=Cynara cardunculus var. scolymus TaxID=59895 RepID=A0A103Y6J3_CYNCS|nr:Glycoside hydrolase, catalytic domain-containing protein [Cynara cardunculus var. scolymus]
MKVTDAFQEASKLGMNVVRTWAFSDGGRKPLQTSPGCYNEDTFKGPRCYFVFLISTVVLLKLKGSARANSPANEWFTIILSAFTRSLNPYAEALLVDHVPWQSNQDQKHNLSR